MKYKERLKLEKSLDAVEEMDFDIEVSTYLNLVNLILTKYMEQEKNKQKKKPVLSS